MVACAIDFSGNAPLCQQDVDAMEVVECPPSLQFADSSCEVSIHRGCIHRSSPSIRWLIQHGLADSQVDTVIV